MDDHQPTLKIAAKGAPKYTGNPAFVHVPEGLRGDAARLVVDTLGRLIRVLASEDGDVAAFDSDKPICPGCYMIELFNAAVLLAKANGQPLTELGRTLSEAFAKLAAAPDSIKEIEVFLDPPDCVPDRKLTPFGDEIKVTNHTGGPL